MQTNFWQRLGVLAALTLYALLVVMAIILAVHNLGLLLTIGVTALFIVYTFWLTFTGNGWRFWAGCCVLAGALAAFIGEVLFFASKAGNIKTLAVAVLLGFLYTGVLSVLRNRYRQEKLQLARANHQTAHFHSPCLIINPKAGNGRALKAHIDKLAPEQGIRTYTLQSGEDVEAKAEEAANGGADVLGISGGDGSIGAVVKVALAHNLPVVVLPGGTRCHFARDIGLEPRHIVEALAGFTGVERRIDVGNINGRIFLNNASFGLYADIVDDPDYRNNKVSVTRRTLQSLLSGSKPLYDLRFAHGNKRFTEAAQILVGVNRYKLLNLAELGQRDRLDQGVLQITAVLKLDNTIVRQLLGSMSIDMVRKAALPTNFFQWDARSFQVTNAAGKMVVGVDGEREELQTPVRAKIIPGALRIYVPPAGPRTRPKNPLGHETISRLWQSLAGSQQLPD